MYINIIKISTIEAEEKFAIETWLDTDNLAFVREHAVSLGGSILKIYDPQQQHDTRHSEVQMTLLIKQGPVILKIEVIFHPEATSSDEVNW